MTEEASACLDCRDRARFADAAAGDPWDSGGREPPWCGGSAWEGFLHPNRSPNQPTAAATWADPRRIISRAT